MMQIVRSLAAGLHSTFGTREITLLTGLGLLGYGAGMVYVPAGFFLPGAVLLYVAIAGAR